jgi:excisionase family DNA binding protein
MIYSTDDVINVREAAQQCGRNAETVRRWIWDGKLPARKLGNQLFIKKKDLALFCREAAVAYRAEGDIKSGPGASLDIATEIDNMWEERMSNIKPGAAGEGFMERAILFRERLRERGYPGIDTAAAVKKSREGRMRELRQGLR